MIERRTEFIDELNRICEDIVKKHGKLNYHRKKLEERFLEQADGSPDNIECIKNLEYAIVMKNVVGTGGQQRKYYGLRIRDTNILLTDISYFLERDEVIDIVLKEYPELSVKSIEAAQRAITLILLAFDCIELGKCYKKNGKAIIFGNVFIERGTEFIDELDRICEDIVKHVELNYDQKKMEEQFLQQVDGSPDNIECIKNLEYALVMKDIDGTGGQQQKYYGLKIKDTNILLTDIAYFLERDEVIDIVLKKYPELSVKSIEAAQRAITLILMAFNCVELGKYYE